MPYQNSASTEADFIMNAKEVAGDDVVIPTPFAVLSYKNESRKFYKDKRDIEVLVMKKVDGFSLDEAIKNPELIKDIDIERFYKALKSFFFKAS